MPSRRGGWERRRHVLAGLTPVLLCAAAAAWFTTQNGWPARVVGALAGADPRMRFALLFLVLLAVVLGLRAGLRALARGRGR